MRTNLILIDILMVPNDIPMKEIDDIANQVQKVYDLIRAQDSKKINSLQKRMFVKGGHFLHQDTDKISEEESARFERENPELFNFLRSLDDQLRAIF